MPELLYSLLPATSTPEQNKSGVVKTPSPSDNVLTRGMIVDKHATPRASDSSADEDLVRAPCKVTPEGQKSGKLSGRHLKFEDGVSFQSIICSHKEDKPEEANDSNPFCEKNEHKFVPLLPQRNSRGRKRPEEGSSTVVHAQVLKTL